MRPLPLRKENGFLPDYAEPDPVTRAQAKLMFLDYPDAPTSVTATPDFHAETVRFAADHHVIVASDFA
jgi:aminotransferase